MRAGVIVLLFVACSFLVRAEDSALPTLTIKEDGTARRLELTALELSVKARGELVEIIYELEFFNHSKRRTEGEFSIQLPEGATVSTYALEVAGEMRPAVSVEKEKALNAYETIKRRGVDPGIVERQENNVYRTRIFPILGEQSKRVRIGYIRRFPQGRPLVIPLRHDKRVEDFSLEVGGVRITREIRGLTGSLSDAEQSLGQTFTATQFRPEINLSVVPRFPVEKKPYLFVSRAPDGTRHFAVQVKAEKAPDPVPLDWKKVRLIWDASHSGRWRDHEQEYSALRGLWKELGNVEVTLSILTTRLSEPELYQITNGNPDALEKRLRQIQYDGAADFSLIASSDSPTLLLSDGVASSPAWVLKANPVQEDFHLLQSTKASIDDSFHKAGVSVQHISEEDWLDSFLSAKASQIVKGIPPTRWESDFKDGLFLLTGHIPPGVQNEVTIRLFDGNTLTIPEGNEAGEWNFARRIRAQQRLAVLESNGSKEAIIEFSKRERIASDETSLIVLEFFSDHLRFEIPPPEPELLERYLKELDEKRTKSLRSLSFRWNRKVERHKKNFPWIDEGLKSEVRTVSIWVRAAREAFPEDQLNKKELEPYLSWAKDASTILDQAHSIDKRGDFKKWLSRLNASKDRLEEIRRLPPTLPEKGPLHVSVRGFVKELGIHSKEAPFFLNKAIKSAKGLNQYGSLERVYLYRNASRIGFNMKSSQFKPVQLEWGDMIVVESEPSRYSHLLSAPFADPFMDVSVPALGGADKPAVFEQAGTAKAKSNAVGQPDPFGNAEKKSILVPTATFSAPPLPKGADRDLLAAFQSDKPGAEVYSDLLSGPFGKEAISLSTMIEIARILFSKGEADLARQCLSNLLEVQSNPIEAVRSYAYWLAELGDRELALEVLKEMTFFSFEPATLALLHQDLGRLSGESASFSRAVQFSLDSPYIDSIATITLTDLNAQPNGASFDLGKESFPSDLRIVITAIGDNIRPRLVEPRATNSVLDSGVIRTAEGRLDEYLIKRAWPGKYQLNGLRWTKSTEVATVHVQFYTNWARKEQTMVAKTFLIEGRGLELGSIEFSWDE